MKIIMEDLANRQRHVVSEKRGLEGPPLSQALIATRVTITKYSFFDYAF